MTKEARRLLLRVIERCPYPRAIEALSKCETVEEMLWAFPKAIGKEMVILLSEAQSGK